MSINNDDVGLTLMSARMVLEKEPKTDHEREAHAVIRSLRVLVVELVVDLRRSVKIARAAESARDEIARATKDSEFLDRVDEERRRKRT